MTELKKTLEPIVEEEPQETSEQQIEETAAPTLESGPTLTDQERAARAKALEEAKRVEEKRVLKEKEDKADEELRSEKAASDTPLKVEEDEKERQSAETACDLFENFTPAHIGRVRETLVLCKEYAAGACRNVLSSSSQMA